MLMSRTRNERSWKQLMRQRERLRDGSSAGHDVFAFREPILEEYYQDEYEMDDFDKEDAPESLPRQSRLS